MSDMVNVSICDGKYTIIQDSTGSTKVLRYNEEWRHVTGDNVILGAAYEIEHLRDRINKLILIGNRLQAWCSNKQYCEEWDKEVQKNV